MFDCVTYLSATGSRVFCILPDDFGTKPEKQEKGANINDNKSAHSVTNMTIIGVITYRKFTGYHGVWIVTQIAWWDYWLVRLQIRFDCAAVNTLCAVAKNSLRCPTHKSSASVNIHLCDGQVLATRSCAGRDSVARTTWRSVFPSKKMLFVDCSEEKKTWAKIGRVLECRTWT